MEKVDTEMHLTDKEYSALNAQAANYRTLLRYFKSAGLDNWLIDMKRPPLDLFQTPDDTTGGESIMLFVKEVADECNRMDKRISKLSELLVEKDIQINELTAQWKHRAKTLFEKLHDFIFVNE